MLRVVTSRALLAWLLAATMLCGAVAPALAKSLLASSGPWDDICSAAARATPSTPGELPPASEAATHCLWCLLPAVALSPAPGAAPLPLLRLGDETPAACGLAFATPLSAWLSPPAQAPPLV